MDNFIGGFLGGIFVVLIYKSNIIDWKQLKTSVLHSEENALFSLLKIDFTEVDANFDQIAVDLVTNLRNAGFVSVHGIEGFDPDELEKWTRWFFDIALQEKMRLAKRAFNIDSNNVYRGYYPIVPGTHSFKEAFETGAFNQKMDRNLKRNKDGRPYMRDILEENNVFPVTEDAKSDEEFRNAMRKYYEIYEKIGRTVVRLIAAGLGFERTKFDELFKGKTISTFRLLHYPTRLHTPSSIPQSAWDRNVAIVTGEHQDSSMLTILATFNYSGLQIKPPGYTSWMDVPTDKNELLINVGRLLAYMVGGNIVATNHRVLDTGNDRYSVPLFFEPHFDADISKTVYGEDNELVGKFTKYGPWMTNMTSQYYEYATTDFGIAD